MAVPVLVAAALSVLMTWAWLRLAARIALTDPPNPLVTQHQHSVATAGGLPAAIAASTTMLLVALTSPPGLRTSAIGVMLIAGAGFLALGVADDVLRLSARSKFFAQLLLAIVGAASGIAHPLVGRPGLDFVIAVITILVLVNAVNLTDVCDGLVAGLLVAANTTIAILHPDARVVALAAAGAALGFLVFNRPPARVFLGDAGTHWFGFMLAAALLHAGPRTTAGREVIAFAFVPGVFLFEVVLLIAARARRGVPFWIASPDHLSLRLQAAGFSRWTVVIAAWTAGVILGLLAIVSRDLAADAQVAILCVTVAAAGAALAAILSIAVPPRRARPGEERPRLLWIHQNYGVPGPAGEARPERILAALVERGWLVDIVTTEAGYRRAAGADGVGDGAIVERDGAQTIHRLRHRGGVNRVRASISFCIRALIYLGQIRRVEVVCTPTPRLPHLLVASVASLVRRAPLAITVPDLWPGAGPAEVADAVEGVFRRHGARPQTALLARACAAAFHHLQIPRAPEQVRPGIRGPRSDRESKRFRA